MVDTHSTFAARLLALKKKHGYSFADIGDAIGVSPQAVHKWTAGGKIDDDKLLALAIFFKVTPSWLMFGDEARMHPLAGAEMLAIDIHRRLTHRHMRNAADVPIISWVTAGAWSEVADPYEPGVAEEWIPCPKRHGPRAFALRIRGISMENPGGKHSYSDGDVIFCDPDRQADNGSRVVVRLDDDKEATFKQLVIEGERRYLRALNPSWPEKIIEVKGEATICGVVIGKWTDE